MFGLLYKYTKKMSNPNIPDILAFAETLKSDMRRYARAYCLQWFDDSFQKQGFTDASFRPWAPRKQPDRRPGGYILIDTTYLRKSLDAEEEGNTMVFGSYAPYAGLHNNGERLRVIQYVRAHHRTAKGKRYQVQAHARKIDVKYPKRQFIGESKLMMEGLDNWLINEIENRFKQL